MSGGRSAIAELTGVSHRFGETLALDHVDFALAAGTVVALLGPNGAGKTTLVRILLGLIAPTEGSARLWERSPSDPESRRRVGAMLQVGGVPDMLTVREHVHLFSSYYGSPVPVDETLAVAGVTAFADTRFGRLSGGQRQRGLFALAICGAPRLLILDEPTAGLDAEARRGFWTGVRAMIARGCSVLLTTHHLEEADAVADRVAILQRGRIVRDASPSAIKRELGGRTIRCTTALRPESLATLGGVRSVMRDGNSLVLIADEAERVVGELLARDPRLKDLEVTGARLEDAVVAVTGNREASARGGPYVEAAGA